MTKEAFVSRSGLRLRNVRRRTRRKERSPLLWTRLFRRTGRALGKKRFCMGMDPGWEYKKSALQETCGTLQIS
ncbi:MAG TPA: hypothetical protein DCM58_01685 [Desulfovibrio sp.]|nr:hypothetical protein [Desulfovibrio sp.]